MTVSFETKLKFFEPDSELISEICNVCGRVFDIQPNQKGHQKRCPECQNDFNNQKKRNHGYYNDIKENTKNIGDPCLDLVLAVIRQAKSDRYQGYRPKMDDCELKLADCDPIEFIKDGGAELWLRCAGVRLDDDAERSLQKLADKRNNRNFK